MPETRPPRAPRKRAASTRRGNASTSPTGVELDPADADDARIIRRQQTAARQAGRSGQNRARVTRGRTDLEREFDEGAADGEPAPEQPEPAGSGDEPAQQDEGQDGEEDDEPEEESGAGGPGGAGVRDALNRAGAPLGSFSPTLRPPTRAKDAGGFLAGLLLYTGVIVYIRYGPAGWKGWLKAKFLNKPMQGLPAGKGGPPAKPIPT